MQPEIIKEVDVVSLTEKEEKITVSHLSKSVVSEISIKLIINGKELISLLCLNQYPEELAVGFLFNEGIIDSYDEIISIDYHIRLSSVLIELNKDIANLGLESLRSITSACGKGLTYINPMKTDKFEPLPDGFKISMEKIWELMKTFNKRSELYTTVGGVHSVLSYHPEFEFFNEDIGRHNCMDKIAGYMLKHNKAGLLTQSVFISSGRVSSEIMTKLVRLKVPVFVSRSAPTAAAIELARKYNITIVGYVRGKQATIYSVPERILI